jgi:DNA repair exonuclease SbcCD nuclease subunit
MKFIHTADWQIGKVFKRFGTKEGTLRDARLAAIERLGELARANGVRHILVAEDIYDNEAPNTITLRAPIERMKPFADLEWHLLPGNHDPHGLKASGIASLSWECLNTSTFISHRRRFPWPMGPFCSRHRCCARASSMISQNGWTVPRRSLAFCGSGLLTAQS